MKISVPEACRILAAPPAVGGIDAELREAAEEVLYWEDRREARAAQPARTEPDDAPR